MQTQPRIDTGRKKTGPATAAPPPKARDPSPPPKAAAVSRERRAEVPSAGSLGASQRSVHILSTYTVYFLYISSILAHWCLASVFDRVQPVEWLS